MILRNGTIRTLDPSLPTVSSLWIAGERIAGGVGVHETSLPSPETVDLGGRCVLPGFTDSHVHFPTWALSQSDVQLHGCASLAEALDRVRAAPAYRELAARAGLARRRLARRPADAPGTRRDRARAPGDADLEGLPRALAQLRGALTRRRRPRGRGRRRRTRRERRADRRALRGGGVGVQGQVRPGARRRVRRGDARGRAGRRVARRHRPPRQGRLARRDRPLAAPRAAGSAPAPRLAVDAGRAARRPARDRAA